MKDLLDTAGKWQCRGKLDRVHSVALCWNLHIIKFFVLE